MEGIYKINLIPNDLSTEETVLQITDALDNLNYIVDDVFTRILSRIKQNTDKTNDLKRRIDVSRAKVDKLTGMQKAIKVFSSAKYPQTITHEHYQSIFDLNGLDFVPKKTPLSGKSQRVANEKSIQGKLHFYHVKVGKPKTPARKRNYDLKSVINNISSVGELLVFNTDECPYFGAPAKTPAYVPKTSAEDENKSLLEAAPSTILRRDVLKREVDEYLYAPGMGHVPELEMPLDLPHLPGIAGDVQYAFTQDGSIAPSVVTSPVGVATSIAEDLPDLRELDVSVPDISGPADPIPVSEKSGLPSVAADMPNVAAMLPDMGAPMAAPTPPAPPAVLPPPPPPPPPPPMDIPVETKRVEKPQGLAPPPPSSGDSRANLMAAIRQAGGAGSAKLRPAAAVDTDDKQAKKPPSGDLMADLHAKLSMRRRGISGAERASGGTVLHTLASIIPEPGDQSSAHASDSGDDWEP